MIDIARYYLLVFGALTQAGGVLGYVKAKSRPSLVAGLTAGTLLVVAGMYARTNGKVGLALGLVISLALAGRFVGAWSKTKKLMPAGVMAALSLVGLALCAAGLALG